MRIILLGITLSFLLTTTSMGDELPEFYGCYLKDSSGGIVELTKNEAVYSTGWFVPKPKSTDNSLQSLQKSLANNDMFSALNAAANTKRFLSGFSNLEMPKDNFKGIIAYSEESIDDIKIFRLSNNVVPNNAKLVEYHGPKPIDRESMWFPSSAIEVRAKPLQDKMYYIAPREDLPAGCYAINMGNDYYDFEIKGSSAASPLVGKWTGFMYYKEKKLFGGNTIGFPIDLFIEEVKDNGELVGTYKQYKPGHKEMMGEGKISELTVDLKEGKVQQINEDEGKEGQIYGSKSGEIILKRPQKCVPGYVKMTMEFSPYEKYQDEEVVKKYKIWEEYEKAY